MIFSTAEGGRHQEAHWADRLVPALEFLLPVVARRRRATLNRAVAGAQRTAGGREGS
jgi:hypothetical protein